MRTRELSPVAGALASVLWGLLVEGIDGGAFSIGAWAWQSLAFGCTLFAWTVHWRFYRASSPSDKDRSSPLM